MRVVDATRMRLVHLGEGWPLQRDPSSKAMVGHLVRNERLVTWLQPIGKGPEAQVPAIRVGKRFCALSVRMMKAIWRDVRLRKDFVNLEPLPQGGFKPRIPERLLQDKRKTQCRFREMRLRGAGGKPKERRGVSIMTRRIHAILQDVIARSDPMHRTAAPDATPLAQDAIARSDPMHRTAAPDVTPPAQDVIIPLAKNVEALPRTTTFSLGEGETMREVLERARRDCPAALADRGTFLRHMSDLYDELCQPAPPAQGARG